MHFDLSKPQLLLAQSVREFCQREVSPERVRELMTMDAGTDERLWQEMADQGWLGMHLEEQSSELGLGLVDLVVVAKEFGRACVPGPWLSTTWAATLLSEIGGAASALSLPQIADSSIQATVAVLGDSAAWCIESTSPAELSSGGRVSGSATMVPHAGQSQFILCPVRRDGQLCLVQLDKNADGVRITATPRMGATRTLYECTFQNVQWHDKQVLATGSDAKKAWNRALQKMTAAVCGEMRGLQQWMLDTTVEYTKTRKQFDRFIGSFQAVQHMCADMLYLADSSRSAVWYAAWALQETMEDATRAVAVAKAYCSDAVHRIGNLAVQVHGSIGFTWQHNLHLYYRRAKADEYLFGDATFHREQLAALTFEGI